MTMVMEADMLREHTDLNGLAQLMDTAQHRLDVLRRLQRLERSLTAEDRELIETALRIASEDGTKRMGSPQLIGLQKAVIETVMTAARYTD